MPTKAFAASFAASGRREGRHHLGTMLQRARDGQRGEKSEATVDRTVFDVMLEPPLEH